MRPVGLFDERFPNISPEELEAEAQKLEKENELIAATPLLLPHANLHSKICRNTAFPERNSLLVVKMLAWAPVSLFIALPSKDGLHDPSRPTSPEFNYLKLLAEAVKSPFYDAGDALRAYPAESVFFQSSHYNLSGNEIVADALSKVISYHASNSTWRP
jgi:hypothetical protein